MSFKLSASLSLLLLTAFISCNNQEEVTLVWVGGEAQGTTYSVKYYAADAVSFKHEIDSILKDIDLSMSTYIDSSIISRVNNNDSTVHLDSLFIEVFLRSKEINRLTQGAFDPSVKPLVDTWGFGTKKKDSTNRGPLDSLLRLVGMNNFQLAITDIGSTLIKSELNAQLDFNGIAQGYSVDVISNWLLSKNLVNHLVEIGGEVITKGKNSKGEKWKVGIDKPVAKRVEGEYQAIAELEDKALATSGNYRKFYIKDGRKYAHTIDPTTGYPVDHSLLSATVVTDDCMSADAYATAFMVFGVDKTLEFLANHKDLNIEIYLIYVNKSGALTTYISEGLKGNLEEQD